MAGRASIYQESFVICVKCMRENKRELWYLVQIHFLEQRNNLSRQ